MLRCTEGPVNRLISGASPQPPTACPPQIFYEPASKGLRHGGNPLRSAKKTLGCSRSPISQPRPEGPVPLSPRARCRQAGRTSSRGRVGRRVGTSLRCGYLVPVHIRAGVPRGQSGGALGGLGRARRIFVALNAIRRERVKICSGPLICARQRVGLCLPRHQSAGPVAGWGGWREV